MLSIGERLPDTNFFVIGEKGPEPRSMRDIFGGRRVVLVGVPGAFTPGCHRTHLPGFVENRDAILERDVDLIAVVSVNDPWVMKAWQEASGATGDILFLSDGNAEFARATGLDADASKNGLGTRLKRFAMIVNDGTVEVLNTESAPGQISDTAAARILELL